MTNAVPEPPDDHGVVDRLAGKAKQIIGSVVGNEDLREEGEIQRAKADAAERARDAIREAEAEAAKAEVQSRAAELQVERAEIIADAAAAVERDELERAEVIERARLDEAARGLAVNVNEENAAEAAAVQARAQRAEQERLAAEAEARRIEQAAAQAKQNASILEHAQNKDQ